MLIKNKKINTDSIKQNKINSKYKKFFYNKDKKKLKKTPEFDINVINKDDYENFYIYYQYFIIFYFFYILWQIIHLWFYCFTRIIKDLIIKYFLTKEHRIKINLTISFKTNVKLDQLYNIDIKNIKNSINENFQFFINTNNNKLDNYFKNRLKPKIIKTQIFFKHLLQELKPIFSLKKENIILTKNKIGLALQKKFDKFVYDSTLSLIDRRYKYYIRKKNQIKNIFRRSYIRNCERQEGLTESQ